VGDTIKIEKYHRCAGMTKSGQDQWISIKDLGGHDENPANGLIRGWVEDVDSTQVPGGLVCYESMTGIVSSAC
jgi:hypothetical protein